MDINRIETECSCGHVTLRIDKSENYSDEELKTLNISKDKQYSYLITFLVATFSSKQDGFWRTLKQRLKLIWYIIIISIAGIIGLLLFCILGYFIYIRSTYISEEQVKDLSSDLDKIVK